MLIVLPIVISIAVPESAGGLRGPWVLVSALNPVWVLLPLGNPRLPDPVEAVERFFLFFLVYGCATAGLIGWIHWRFDRIMGRV
jgi:hypothetical protein